MKGHFHGLPLPLTTLVSHQWSQSQSPNPRGPAACHAHSLTAARRWLRVPKSEIIWKIYTQGIHTPQTQMYTIPITTEVLSGKHQSHSGPTLPSTWAHCHAHSLRAAARCQVYVPTSGIIIWKIHTQGLHTPGPTPDIYDTHIDGGPLGKTPKSVHFPVRSHTVKHVGPLPRSFTESCCTLSAPCTHVQDNNMENTHTGASHAHTPEVYDTHNDGGPLGKIPESVHSPVRSHTVKHVGPLPRSFTESCCTLSAPCTHVQDNNMENTHTGASHTHTPDVYDTHNDGGPLGKIPESVGSSVRSHTVKHVGPLPRPCGTELSKSWPHLDHRQASAHRSSAHHRPQCATMLPRLSPRDCNNYPGFRHHVGDVNQAQCRRAYSRHNSWVSMAADELRMRLLLCQRSIHSFPTHHYINMSHMYSRH